MGKEGMTSVFCSNVLMLQQSGGGKDPTTSTGSLTTAVFCACRVTLADPSCANGTMFGSWWASCPGEAAAARPPPLRCTRASAASVTGLWRSWLTTEMRELGGQEMWTRGEIKAFLLHALSWAVSFFMPFPHHRDLISGLVLRSLAHSHLPPAHPKLCHSNIYFVAEHHFPCRALSWSRIGRPFQKRLHET